jgi:O-antigen/teichoic acid export membrane protein
MTSLKEDRKSRGKKETLYAFLFSLASKAITYLLLLVFANLYLPEEYGLGTFALNIRNIVMMVAFIGLPDALIPFVVKNKKTSSIINNLSAITLVTFAIGLFLSAKYPWILPLVITYPLVMLTSVASAFLRAEEKYHIPVRAGFTSIIIILAAAYFLKSYEKLGVISAYAIGNLYAFFATAYPVRGRMNEVLSSLSIKKFFDFNESKPYFVSAFFITIIAGMFMLLNWLNSTLLGVLGTFSQVAQFGIASAIAGVISVIPISLSMFIITRSSQLIDSKKSVNLLHRVVRVSFFSSLLSSILLVTLIPLLIRIFFPKYIGIESSVSVLTLGIIFFSSYYIVYSYYIGKMKTQKALIPIFMGVLINTLIAILTIKNYGILGASAAISLAHLSVLIWMSRKERIKRITLASLLAIALIYITYMIGYYGFIILILTIPISLLFKIITLEDIKVIKDAFFEIIYVKNA